VVAVFFKKYLAFLLIRRAYRARRASLAESPT